MSLGVFNSELMNDAVYKFKRYEDSSLEYTGIDMHNETIIGLWDTSIDTAKLETPVQPVEQPQLRLNRSPGNVCRLATPLFTRALDQV